MTTVSRTYTSAIEAQRAVGELRAGGVPGDRIRVLTGRPPADLRREPAGGFAGPVGPDDLVGIYGGTTIRRRQGAGAFAGDPDRQRQGSFADTDRVTIVGQGDGRVRITGLRGARRLLGRAGLADASVDAAVAVLHRGGSVVLVDAPSAVQEHLAGRVDEERRAPVLAPAREL